MKKISAFYAIAAIMFTLGILSCITAYREIQHYSSLTQRSVRVYTAFQELSKQITNAAVINPDLIKAQTALPGSILFSTDSMRILRLLSQLDKSVVTDTVNRNISKQLGPLVKTELAWMVRSNVPDSIVHSTSRDHIKNLAAIDLLIRNGIDRTNFLFRYREKMLSISIDQFKLRIIFFLLLAFAVTAYASVSLLRQYTLRHDKEKQLQTQEKKFRVMVENSQDLIAMLDKNMHMFYRSPSAERITGFKTDEWDPASNAGKIHPDDLEKVKAWLEEVKLIPGKVIQVSYRLKHKSGSYIFLEGSFTGMLHDPDLQAIIVNVKDVSKRKAAEEDLRKSEQHFRHTLEHMMEGVQIIGFDWRYIYVNGALTRYSTFTREQMIGKTVHEIYPGVEQTALYGVLKQCMENRVSQHLESEFVFPDGTGKFFELSIQPVPEGISILSVDISERKRAFTELEKNIKELSDLKYALDESAIVAITDQKGIIRHVNDNFCRIAKYDREELLGKDHHIINSGFHSRGFFRDLWKTIASGRVWQGEIRNKASDGSIYWVHTTIIPFLDVNSKPYQYLTIRYDITERKKAEKEIIKLNRLQAFISAINQSIVHSCDEAELLRAVCDIAIETGDFRLARIEMLNPDNTLWAAGVSGHPEAMKEVRVLDGIDYSSGVAKETPAGKALASGKFAINNDMFNDPALADIKDAMARAGARSGISLPLRRSGKIVGVFTLTSSQIGFFDQRETSLLIEAAEDISFALDAFEKTRLHAIVEQQVVLNEQRFRALIENSTDLTTLTSSGGTFVYASPSVSKVFGYTEEEFLHRPAYEFFHPEDVPGLLKKRTEILDVPGASFEFQYRIRHKNGQWIWCEGTLTNMLHEPAIHALVSNVKDISERKKAEEQKEFDRNNLDALINNTLDLQWSLDKNLQLITFNQPFFQTIRAFTGIDIQKGQDVLQAALSEEHRQRFEKLYARALAGEAFTITDVVEGSAGYSAEISFSPMRSGNEIIGTACYSRDISGRLKEEKEREKMIMDLTRYTKNLEQFAYVVSHNLRSPVANIIGLSNLLNSELPEEDKQRSRDYLLKAVNQLDTVVKDLHKILEIRAIVGANRETVNFREILQGIEDSISGILKEENVSIRAEFDLEELTSVKSYIFSIFYNLITNSIKYKQTYTDPLIRIRSYTEPGKAILVFSDNGLGMDLEKYGAKIFGLYQRFHLDVSGKGMGLFMVKTQVETLEGTISLRSVPGMGSEFTIELPYTN